MALIARLVHNAEIIAIKGKSYRQKEAQERVEQRSKKTKSYYFHEYSMKNYHQRSGLNIGLDFLISCSGPRT